MRTMTFILAVVLVGAFALAEDLPSEVYRRVSEVYGSSPYFDAETLFDGVRGGDGLLGNADTERAFLRLVPVVSNGHARIVGDWGRYGTNEVVRFTVLSAVGYSGKDIYTNFTAALVARYERTRGEDDWKSVLFLFSPYQTPMERTLVLDCDSPSVRSILTRIRACAAARSDVGVVGRCDSRLSGKAREEYLEMKAAGAVE